MCENTNSQGLLNALSTLIAVILGGTITLIGNYFIQRQRNKINYNEKLFDLRINFYLQFIKILSRGYTTLVATNQKNGKKFPKAYQDYDSLSNWLNESASLFDSSLLLVEESIFKEFSELNSLMINHLKTIDNPKKDHDKDEQTRSIGRREIEQIVKLTLKTINAIIKHLNSTYKLKIEPAILPIDLHE